MQRRVIIVVLVLAAALLLAVLALLGLPSQRPSSVQLADGSTLTLHHVSFHKETGTERRLPGFHAIHEAVAAMFSRPTYRRWAPTNSLIFWVSRKDREGRKFLDFDWWAYGVAVDSHGCQFGVIHRTIHSPRWAGSGAPLPAAPANAKYILASGVLTSFPRREEKFKLRFYDQRWTMVAELEVPNPTYQAYPEWSPRALPQAASDAKFSAILRGLTNRWTIDDQDRIQKERFSLSMQADTIWRGEPRTDWELDRIHVEDATGNSVQAEKFGFCTNETAWKLRASFYRTALGTFASNEVWTVPKVSIPPPGVANILSASHAMHGVNFQLLTMSGPGDFTYSNAVPIKASPLDVSDSGYSFSGSSRQSGGISIAEMSIQIRQPHLIVRAIGMMPDMRISVRALTGEGRTPLSETSGFGEYKLFRMEKPPAATNVTLEFALHRPRNVEFVVSPPAPVEQSLPWASAAEMAKHTLPRDPAASPAQLDLSEYFNVPLRNFYLHPYGPVPGRGTESRGVQFPNLPVGLTNFGGVSFDVRGIVHLDGLAVRNGGHQFPRRITEIPIGQKVRQLHLLQGCNWIVMDGTEIGQYVAHYDDGETAVIPIIYGTHVRDWTVRPGDLVGVTGASQVWTDPGDSTPRRHGVLYELVWENPRPEALLRHLDLISKSTSASPLLMAITVEP